MNRNKKDFLLKTILLQFCVCVILFGLLFAMKNSNLNLFYEFEKMFSEKLEEHITVEEAEEVFSNLLKNKEENKKIRKSEETEYIPFEEPSLSAEIIASGGKDIKVSSLEEIPGNVSIDDYKLSYPMFLPVDGEITSKFGTRTHPISGDLRFHAGIDIAAKEGANISAAFDGVVVEADFDNWNGNYLKIKHDNNIMTVYCHCKKLNVKKGEKIRAGEVVATVGSTGSSTGPHLHFELRFNNISYNPQKALNGAVNEF